MQFYNSDLDAHIYIYFDGTSRDSQLSLLIDVLNVHNFHSDDPLPYTEKPSPFQFSFEIVSESNVDKSFINLIQTLIDDFHHDSLFLSSNFENEVNIDAFLITINITRDLNTHTAAIYCSDANFDSEPRVEPESIHYPIGEVVKDGVTEHYPDPTIVPPVV